VANVEDFLGGETDGISRESSGRQLEGIRPHA
jgi:hypothetical protein